MRNSTKAAKKIVYVALAVASVWGGVGYAEDINEVGAHSMVHTMPSSQSASGEEKTWDTLSEQTRQLSHELKQYSAKKRVIAEEKAQVGLAEMQEKIQALNVQLDTNWKKMQAAVREQYAARMKTLKNEQEAAKSWLESLKNSTDTDWASIKESFISTFNSLYHHWKKLTKKLRNDVHLS